MITLIVNDGLQMLGEEQTLKDALISLLISELVTT